MLYILNKQIKAASLDEIRQEYNFLSYDLLHELDENFKKFLVTFFYSENLPAYSLFIENDGVSADLISKLKAVASGGSARPCS